MISQICVQGLGFVGIATATVIASVKNEVGNPLYNVIGVDLNTELGLKRINSVNSGNLPFSCEDEEFKKDLNEAAIINKNLRATHDEKVYQYADVIVVGINLDVKKNKRNYYKSKVLIEDFITAIRILGKNMKKDCLILIESTIPPGTTKRIVEDLIKEEFYRRGIESIPLICHSSERVMPGNNYLDSIVNYWRNFSSNCEKARQIAEKFLTSFINIKQYPLTYFKNTTSTELAKVLENSFRALNIAFIYEWTLLAEKIGINLFKVINSIKKRKGTHDNMMKPGFGVGGYCLPKDGLLAQWSIENIFHISNLKLKMTIEALKINDKMPLHTFDLIKNELGSVKGKKFVICGASYLSDIADLRNTPTKVLYTKIKEHGGTCQISDPFVNDFEGVFDINDIYTGSDFKDYDVIIFAVRYESYLNLNPIKFVKSIKRGALIVDTFDILNDEKIKYFLKERINVIGVGKGHIKYMKNEIL